MLKIKNLILKDMLHRIENKIISIQDVLKDTIYSRDSDSKSSAGDKHETSRAKIQTEIDLLNKQLGLLNRQKQELSNIDFCKNYSSATIGSLVKTNNGSYFISIGIGRININNEIFYAISLVSPIGILLKNKKIGDVFSFRNTSFKIIDIS